MNFRLQKKVKFEQEKTLTKKIAVKNLELVSKKNEIKIDDEKNLTEIFNDYYLSETVTKQLAISYPREVLQTIKKLPEIKNETLSNKKLMDEWVLLFRKVIKEINEKNNTKKTFNIKLNENVTEEKTIFIPSINLYANSLIRKKVFLTQEFFSSENYKNLIKANKKIFDLFNGEEFNVNKKNKTKKVRSFTEAHFWITKEVKSGLTLQRYKGLGEMNPKQLEETTMNQKLRRLVKVTVGNAIEADQVFSILMGSQIDARKEFISKNAVYVSNLDI